MKSENSFRTLHNMLYKMHKAAESKNIRFNTVEQAFIFFVYRFYNDNRYNKETLFITQKALSEYLSIHRNSIPKLLNSIGYTDNTEITDKTLMYYKITPKGVEIKIQ